MYGLFISTVGWAKAHCAVPIGVSAGRMGKAKRAHPTGLMTEIPIMTPPLFIVRTLLNRNTLLRQLRLVETSQLRGDVWHVMISIAVYLEICDVIRLAKASKIK